MYAATIYFRVIAWLQYVIDTIVMSKLLSKTRNCKNFGPYIFSHAHAYVYNIRVEPFPLASWNRWSSPYHNIMLLHYKYTGLTTTRAVGDPCHKRTRTRSIDYRKIADVGGEKSPSDFNVYVSHPQGYQ